MVLPAPAADAVAAQAGAWLGKLKRALDRSSGGMVVLLREATLPWVGPVVRELSPEPPWSDDEARVLRVCLTAPELSQVEVGSRVLLRVRPQDATWLNLYRPLVVDRELRLILWADGEATDALQREAVDFFSWIVRVIEVPAATLPEFAIERMRSALESGREIAWRGPMLTETLGAVGWSEGVVELSAAMDYERMLDALKQPGLAVVSNVASQRDGWRVRFALAHVGRPERWVAVDPADECTGFLELGIHQLDWHAAAERLEAAGRSHAALLAAWLNLEPAAIEEQIGASREVPSSDGLTELVDQLRDLGDNTPSEELVRECVRAGFVEVAMQLERLRWIRGDARNAGWLVDWLVERGRTLEALDVATEWCERAKLDDSSRSLAGAYVALGDIHVALGKGEDARRYLEDALAIQQELVERDPERTDLRRDLSISFNKLGDIHVALGKGEKARRYFEDALAIAQELVEREPERTDLRRDLSISYERLGGIHVALAKGEEARRYFEDALAIRKELVERDPERTDLRRDLSISFNELGDLNVVLGKGEDARRYFEDALAITRELVEREPERTDLRRDLSISYERLGDLNVALGKVEEARRHFEDALAITQELVEREPDRTDLRRDLSVSYNKLGDIHVALGKGEEARRYFEDALAIARGLVEREPDRTDLRRELSVFFNKLGDIHMALGNGEEARRYFEDALAIRKDLVEREPDRTDLRRDLSISYARLAKVEPKRATEYLGRAIELSRGIVARAPDHAHNTRILGIQLIQLSSVLEDANQQDAARAAAREALALLRSLDNRGALEHGYRPLLNTLAERYGESPGVEQTA